MNEADSITGPTPHPTPNPLPLIRSKYLMCIFGVGDIFSAKRPATDRLLIMQHQALKTCK